MLKSQVQGKAGTSSLCVSHGPEPLLSENSVQRVLDENAQLKVELQQL